MPVNALVENEQVVRALGLSIRSGGAGLKNVPLLVRRVIGEGRWRERAVGVGNRAIAYDDFARFVADPPLEGLGTDITTIRRLCADDPEALDLIDRVGQRPVGQPSKEVIVDNVHNNQTRPTGNRADRALRALRAHAPDIHAEVLAGGLSPHGGMVKAGLRRPTATFPLDPPALARAIRTKLDDPQVDALIRELEEGRG